MTQTINIIELAETHGQTSYRNRADTAHPAYGFTEEGLQAFAHALLAAEGKCLHQTAGLERDKSLQPTQPAAQGMDAREFPPMTPELASILGLMCFQCISFAKALRAAGHTIKTRAEDEQAAVLHWMLGHYFRHGDDWRTAAATDMERMKAKALAAQAKQGERHGQQT